MSEKHKAYVQEQTLILERMIVELECYAKDAKSPR